MCADVVLITTPDFTSSHTFSMDDLTGTFDGLTQGMLPEGDTSMIDTTFSSPKNADGTLLYPINSEFGFLVDDFTNAFPKDFFLNPEHEEGWIGDLKDEGGDQQGVVISDAPTDTFKTPAIFGRWLSGLGGNSVKAETEHYVVMQNVLSDQKYPGDPDALYPLDDNLVIVGGTYDGMLATDALAAAGDVNDDGVVNLVDILAPNETEITQNIAISSDYSVTLKDDGKLLFRWGNMIKKPNDVRLDVKLDLPDEFTEIDPDSGLTKLFKITAAELATDHTVTNNPNDQIRPEDLENEAATGQKPGYIVISDYTADGGDPREVWVSDGDFYAGDGTLFPEGTILRDDALIDAVQGTLLDQLGALSSDLVGGFTNAWYTTMDREPFEPVLNEAGDDYIVGSRWRLEPNKYGQDLPGVEIPLDPSLPPPPTKDEVKYVVGDDTTTVINLLDWKTTVSPLSISAGYHNNSGSVSSNGANMTNDLDVVFYVKGDVKPATLYNTNLFMTYEEINIAAVGADVTGGDGDDYLVGQGVNTFFGGTGSDLFVLSYGASSNWADLTSSTVTDFTPDEDMLSLIDLHVTELNFDDTVVQSVEADGLHVSLGDFEIATLSGLTEELDVTDFVLINRTFGDDITGTSEDDYLVGDAGDNLILGLAGNDTLLGLAGDDTLNGGTGADLMEGGEGSDVMIVDNVGDVVLELASWSGIDTVRSSINFRMTQAQHLEQLQLVDNAIVGAGNDLDNRIAGNAQDNILDGGQGVDVMLGGAGNDTYIARHLSDTVIEAAGRGYDTVKSYVNHMLSDNVERLFLQAATDGDGNPLDINGIGNSRNNVIVGNNNDNLLQGRDGLDVLRGQLGADTFAFVTAASATNTDRIIDFNTNVAGEGDTLLFRSAAFTGLTAGTLDAEAFVLGMAAADAADRFIFDQAGGNLWYDADGTGALDQELVATFDQGAVLTADDFFIV